MRTSGRRAATQSEESPRADAEAAPPDAAAELPPPADFAVRGAASLLRRGSVNASAALAALREPLSHTWLAGTAGTAAPAAQSALSAEAAAAAQPRDYGGRVRALASNDGAASEPEDDSDDDLQASMEQTMSARRVTLARLLDEQDSADSGMLSAEQPAAALRGNPARGSAALEADLLAQAGGEASVGSHPLAQSELSSEPEDDAQSAPENAAAFSGLWASEPPESFAAAELLPPDTRSDAALDAASEPASLADALEQPSAWAVPPAADAEAAACTAAACRQALRTAAAEHLQRVLVQVLACSGVPCATEWVPVLADLAAAAAAAVQPAAGGAGYSMDVRDYLCVKRCPSGRRSDSRLVCGVVCRRNVAHRRMATHIESPRLLLLAGALQYQRVEGRLSSLDTLLEQERAHLRVACARAAALRPSVVLVEKSCARYAQELLLAQGISLVLNVKPAVLRRLARATGAAVAPGADQLREVHVGSCGAFRVEPLDEELAAPPGASAAASPRTLMVFDGCPRPLCATVVLAGASPEELSRVKLLMPWAVYAAHHLRLEAAFLADELTAANVSAPDAAAAVAAAVARAAATLERPPFPRSCRVSLSPHTCAALTTPPLGSDERAPLTWAADALRAEERLLVSLSCRCPARRALCEPHYVRAIDHYCGTDVPLGHFLAAALPGPGRRCGCGVGPEAHVRSYAAGAGQLTLHVRPTAVAAPSGSSTSGVTSGATAPSTGRPESARESVARTVWHWSSCAACAAAGVATPPRRRILLSEASLQFSLGKFLALSLTALELRAPCGHSLHADALRFFGTPAGTACIALAPLARTQVWLPPRMLLPVRGSTLAWVDAELRDVATAAAPEWAELRASLRASYAQHVHALAGTGASKEPPVLLSELESSVEDEARAFAARLADAEANVSGGRPDIFAVNRMRRMLASTRRKWAAVLSELSTTAWRSSFPVNARRGWADGTAAGAAVAASLIVQALAQPAAPAAAPASTAATHSRTPSDRAAQPPVGRASLPLGVGGAAVVIYDDEPTSVIAYALASQQYASALGSARTAAVTVPAVAAAPAEPGAVAALAAAGVRWDVVASPATAHVRCAFEERDYPGGAGAARFNVTAYYAPQFDALRALWGVSAGSLLRTLCRCAKWESSGGKSGAYFAKTRDDRLVVKALSRPELGSMLEFAPAYAAYAAAAATEDRPVLLAKLVGVFSVSVVVAGRRDVKLDCVIMENLFAGGGFGPVFDLKGSAGKSRAAPDDAPVQLDENLLDRVAGADAPLCVSPLSAAAVSAAVWRDTAFLARLGVMDYSLLVGLQPRRRCMAVGIVDYLRQYTWDKQLETYVKSSSAVLALGGGSGSTQPTIISPKQYARRFRKAMRSYFVVIPDIGASADDAAAAADGERAATAS